MKADPLVSLHVIACSAVVPAHAKKTLLEMRGMIMFLVIPSLLPVRVQWLS